MQLHTYVLKLIYLRSNIKEIYDHHTKHMQKIIMTPFKWNCCILLLKNDQSVLTDYWARVMTFNQVLWKWALFKNLKFYPKSKVHIWEKHWVKYHHGSQLYYSSPMNLCLSISHTEYPKIY